VFLSCVVKAGVFVANSPRRFILGFREALKRPPRTPFEEKHRKQLQRIGSAFLRSIKH